MFSDERYTDVPARERPWNGYIRYPDRVQIEELSPPKKEAGWVPAKRGINRELLQSGYINLLSELPVWVPVRASERVSA